MSMTVRILSAKYNVQGPEILGALRVDNLGEINNHVLFTSSNRNGQWRIHDFARGGSPPTERDNRMIVSLVEVGECDELRQGDVLTSTRRRA